MALKRLHKEYKALQEYSEFSCSPCSDNFFEWDIIIFGPNDTIFEGGIYEAKMKFSPKYPIKAPEFYFTSKLTHPNVYKDGKMCISILHEGKDEFGYESLSERWSPQQGISSVLLSIISVLGEPNFESPANVDASVLWQKDYEKMKKIVYKEIALTQR